MLQRVEMAGIPLPRLYIAENRQDIELARKSGIPYIKWSQGQEELIKVILRPFLERMFPDIRWNKILGRHKTFKTKVMMVDGGEGIDADDEAAVPEVTRDSDGELDEHADIATSERTFSNGNTMVDVEMGSIEEYVGDLSSYVNLEVLQSLRIMPAFIGDIIECIKLNVGSGIFWQEGYNKKRGLYVGNYNAAAQLPNLIIVDVSYSIPRGIAATMLTLVDTLRTQVTADVIITGRYSYFFPMGAELPDAQRLRNMVPTGQESKMFIDILNKHVRGRHYGHVFSFGDYDQPYYGKLGEHIPDNYNRGYIARHWKQDELDLTGTIVEHVHHYHTTSNIARTGYAKWCHTLNCKPQESHDKSWCQVIYE